mmetsp:Transcript_18771/g.51740  ORF Transcript_18771/g.51740 Transcript_18771/m.51740 type:complete len:132 (-) Transcript_18771:84-479(-)
MRFPKLHPSRLDLTITLQDVWQNEPVCGITCYGATKASASCDYSCYRYQTCLFMQQSLANTLSRRSAQQAALIEAKLLPSGVLTTEYNYQSCCWNGNNCNYQAAAVRLTSHSWAMTFVVSLLVVLISYAIL